MNTITIPVYKATHNKPKPAPMTCPALGRLAVKPHAPTKVFERLDEESGVLHEVGHMDDYEAHVFFAYLKSKCTQWEWL